MHANNSKGRATKMVSSELSKDSAAARTTRRDFLKASTVAASGAMTAALGIGHRVFAAGSDIIRVGMVGCGGRNTGAANEALTADPGARLAAMCDIFMDRVKSKREILQEKRPGQVIAKNLAAERGYIWNKGAAKTLPEAALLPHGHAMVVPYTFPRDSGLRVGRRGTMEAADGRMAVFDVLLVPAGDEGVRIELTGLSDKAADKSDRPPVVKLPPDTELTYGDLLQLAYEQNTELLEGMLANRPKPSQFQLPPAVVLPALRRRIREHKNEGETAKPSPHLRGLQWLLTDLYLF